MIIYFCGYTTAVEVPPEATGYRNGSQIRFFAGSREIAAYKSVTDGRGNCRPVKIPLAPHAWRDDEITKITDLSAA